MAQFSILLALLFFATNSCRTQRDSACLLSAAQAPVDAGFAKVPGGFVVFTYRGLAEGGSAFQENETQQRISASFEFLQEKDENGDSRFFVDVVSPPNVLYLGSLDRVYAEVYLRGQYLKIPIVPAEYLQANEVMKQARTLKSSEEVLGTLIKSLDQAPVTSDAKTRVEGKEKSIHDVFYLEQAKSLCQDLEGDSCRGIDQLRVVRFEVQLSDFHLSRTFREELVKVMAEHEDLIAKIRAARLYLQGLRPILQQFVGSASRYHAEHLENMANLYPDLYKAYGKYRSYMHAVLDLEKHEAKLEVIKYQEKFCNSELSSYKEVECKELKALLDAVKLAPLKVLDEACVVLDIQSWLAQVRKSKEPLNYQVCQDSLQIHHWGEHANSFAIEVDQGAITSDFLLGRALLLGRARALIGYGLAAYGEVIQAAKTAGVSPLVFTNFVAGIDQDGVLDSDSVFYGGFPLKREVASRIQLRQKFWEFVPMQSVASLMSPWEEGSESSTVSVDWLDAKQSNLGFCFQMGSQISLSGLPVLGLFGGCDQSGGAVIVPPPYTGGDTLLGSNGDSGEVIDEPDTAEPVASADPLAKRDPEAAEGVRAEDFLSDQDGPMTPEANSEEGIQAERYRTEVGDVDAVAKCGP
jgi:hypothetical protein